jgi:hypothetical protein
MNADKRGWKADGLSALIGVHLRLNTTSQLSAHRGGAGFSLPSPSCRGAAGGELRSAVGKLKHAPPEREAQSFSASCLEMGLQRLPLVCA